MNITIRILLGMMISLANISANAAESSVVPVSSVQESEPVFIELPKLKVDERRIESERINKTQSITMVTSKDLERTQSSSIFDAIKDVPGVSIQGGPRPSGMSFNIRGYTDNEDVLVKVDGVTKGFEKYRMGGTFIEPELLKSIEVQRGPQITSGSGSLGGTINATTKSASDFLAPNQRYGARVKFGYANNNDEYSRSYIAYARPDDRVDILYNYSNRTSNNITLPDGTALDSSAIESVSKLLKFSLFPIDTLALTTSVVSFQDSGLQPYDSTGGQPGSFGNVIRSIDDFTWSQGLSYKPDNRWVDLKVTYGQAHTKLHDLIKEGMSPSINAAGSNNGNLNDYYDYESTTLDIANNAELLNKETFKVALLTGYQYNQTKRDVRRILDNTVNSNIQYPGGFNGAAPPGTKTSQAVYLQPRFELGALSITPGIRYDNYEIEAAGGTLKILQQFNEPSEIQVNPITYSLGLAYDLVPKQLSIFANFAQGFRPPLVDQYFTRGSYGSNCATYYMPKSGPKSGICGSYYQLQTSQSEEVGVHYQNPRLFGTEAQVTSKLTYFHVDTEHLLSSLGETNTGKIVQRGAEVRDGVELESTLYYRAIFARLAYSSIWGDIKQDARNKSLTFNTFETIPLYTAPADAFNLTLGAQITPKVEANVGYRHASDRVVVLSGGTGTPFVFGTQKGYETFNAGLHWAPSQQVGFRVIGENLGNTKYNLDGAFGGSIGVMAPGRNVRFIVELTY
ncbi:MAG TPA: TonB-dependent receptor plug domain-containing protein [Methylophilaceae bacterium]|jgi:hemoglobin/transferrin/lactoferrin receptor protein